MGPLEPINFANIVSDNIMSPHWECQLPEDVIRDGLSHVTPPPDSPSPPFSFVDGVVRKVSSGPVPSRSRLVSFIVLVSCGSEGVRVVSCGLRPERGSESVHDPATPQTLLSSSAGGVARTRKRESF